MEKPSKEKSNKEQAKRDNVEKSAVYVVLALSIIALVFTFYTILRPLEQRQMQPAMPKHTKMGFTSFDVQLANEFMDKNHDGACDACGMRIEDCIKSGMMQCTMDTNAKMGLLGSAHTHADFKVYSAEVPIDFAKQEYYMKSMFMHLDNQPNKEDAGGVLHMHAKGVPLWLFFKSIGFEIPKGVKLYVNGKVEPQGVNYVFKEGDKLLFTDAQDQAAIQQQFASIGNYAKDHAKPQPSAD